MNRSGVLQRQLNLAERRRRQIVPIMPPPSPSARFVPCRHADIFDPQRLVRAFLALAILGQDFRPPSFRVFSVISSFCRPSRLWVSRLTFDHANPRLAHLKSDCHSSFDGNIGFQISYGNGTDQRGRYFVPMGAEFCQLLTGDGYWSSQVRILGKSGVFDRNTSKGVC